MLTGSMNYCCGALCCESIAGQQSMGEFQVGSRSSKSKKSWSSEGLESAILGCRMVEFDDEQRSALPMLHQWQFCHAVMLQI